MNRKAAKAAYQARLLTAALRKLRDPLKRAEARAERDWQRRRSIFHAGRAER